MCHLCRYSLYLKLDKTTDSCVPKYKGSLLKIKFNDRNRNKAKLREGHVKGFYVFI